MDFNLCSLLNISFNIDYLPLLIVVATAWLVPMLMSLFRIEKVPSIIIEIVGGYFIGRYFFGSFSAESISILDFLALSGFMFLMFQSGLEINTDQIISSFPRKKITYPLFLKNPLLVGLAIFIITILLSYLGANFLSLFVNLGNKWYFSLIMITSSVGIIVPILKNHGDINTRFGQMIIVAAALADILSIILFSFTAFIIKKGFKIEILLIFVLFIAFYISYHIGTHLKKNTTFKRITYQLDHAASQINVRGTILLLLIFVVLAQFIGEELMLLGAFLSGLLLSIFLHKERSSLILKLEGMGYGFFIPIFFIMIGMRFDFSDFKDIDTSLYTFLSGLLIILYVVKVVPSLLWARLFGFRKAISGGFLLSSRLSLVIAASKIGLDLGIISPGINACFIIMAVVTCLFSPIIYNLINPKTAFIRDKTIIIGGSSTSVILAKRLKMHGKSSIIVESDTKRLNELQSKGLNTLIGSGTDTKIYEKLKLYPSNYVVLLTGSDEKNIKIAKILRNEFGHEHIITKSDDSIMEKKLKLLDVEILDVRGVIATAIENLILRPITYHTLVETFENFSVEEIKITNRKIDGLQLKEMPCHKDGTFILIKRDNKIKVPHGNTHLKINDIVFVLGTISVLNDIKTKLRI